jgi:hypothetical protein
VKFRIPRYLWIVGALALSLAGLAAMSGDVWGRTDQRSGGGAPPAAQNRSGDQRQGGRGLSSVLPPERWEWWKDPEFKKEVRLTDAQSARIDQIFRERQRAYMLYDAEFDKVSAETNRMAAERTASIEEFAVQASRMEALRAKLLESRWIMLYRISKELTPEQYKKLDEYRTRRAQSRGRGGQR